MKKLSEKIDFNISDQWKSKLFNALYYILVFLYLEVILHLVMFKDADLRIIYPIVFSVVSGAFIYVFCSLFPEKVNKYVGMILILCVVIYFEVQLVYHCIFGTFMPFSQMTMGAEAVTNFSGQVVHAIVNNLWKLVLIFVPVPVIWVVLLTKTVKTKRLKLLQIPICLLCAFALGVGTVFFMRAVHTSDSSAYAVLVNEDTSTESSVKNLGLAITTVQELRGFYNAKGGEDTVLVFGDTSLNDSYHAGSELNVTDIDFTKLTSEDEKIAALNTYLSSVSATSKNKYTGIAEGYNLITICAESFSPLVIDEELTPTLYKLSTNGFVFKNFYNSFANTTTNGEFAMCTGLMPNMSRTKVESSFDDSIGKYLPYCLGNVYSEMGFGAYAYHNYYGTFYDRIVSHANMGYEFKAIDAGLDMEVQWPSSDLTMMELSMNDYMDSENPFHAYYMTFSGHYQYDWKNAMSNKNRQAVENLPYSDTVKAYIACNLELEYALQSLMEGLEAAGKADRTVIVLTGDHYPYGLTKDQYNELAGAEVDTAFERYRNSFICYVPGIDSVEVDDYCSTIDILPTVLNIMGIEYDSRLLPGKDVLSDGVHVAILSDRSFITNEFKYDAAEGVAVTHGGEAVDASLVSDYRAYVDSVFTVSNGIMETNYYSYIFDEEATQIEQTSHKYFDIDDVFTEAAVSFAVNQGYMNPDSETSFGAKRVATCSEMINALYIMAGKPSVENNSDNEDALIWAMNIGLADDVSVWEKQMTYGDVSKLIYGYVKHTRIIEEPDDAELASLIAAHPDLTKDELIAMKWCNDRAIINGPEAGGGPFVLYDLTVNRGQVCCYIQRFLHI